MHESAVGATRGATRLTFEAVAEIARIVEGMHANIAAGSAPWGEGTDGRTRGVTGLVYDSIRRVNRATEWGVDRAIAAIGRPLLGQTRLPQPQWDVVLSILNGVLGSHLVERENPLAIPMQLRRDGRPIVPGDSSLGDKLLLQVHGLCMNDRLWCRKGHDHGAALAQEFGYARVSLFYNSGRHVSENGRKLAERLEELVVGSPEPVEEIAILAHSMGGLIARSACHLASRAGYAWPGRLRQIVFLGTPHHGVPLERVGSWIHGLAGLSPYVAPLARLGMLRSAGITDLRHGSVLDDDWQDADRFASRRDPRRSLPLPEGVSCYAIAGALLPRGEGAGTPLLGDGLVPVESALGRHPDARQALAFPEDHQWIGPGIGHLDLLARPEVCDVIRSWLADPATADASEPAD